MSDMPLHRLYRHYSELPYSQRVLYTMTLLVLGLGYLFALIYLFHTYAGRAGGNPMMLSYNDILTAYTGSGKGSRLESALRGPMSTMLPHDEANMLITWVHDGGDRAKYDTDIKPVLDQRCMSCHDGSNPHIPNFSGYDNLKKVTEQDTGADVFTLTHRIWLRFRHDIQAGMRLRKGARIFAIRVWRDPDERGNYLVCLCEEVRP